MFSFFSSTSTKRRAGDKKINKIKTKKKKVFGVLDSRLDQAGICEGVPIRDRPFRGKLDPSTF